MFSPEGYVLLRDAFNEVGRELFGENWTDLELAAEGDENDKAAVERRSRAESAFRGRAHAGRIEAFLLDKETGELNPCPRQCWFSVLVEINWSSSTMELVNRSAEEASPKTEPPVLDPMSRPEQFEEWQKSQRSPIEGMLWHYRYRVLVQQAPTAAVTRSMSEASSGEPVSAKGQSLKPNKTLKPDSYRTGGPGRPTIRHLIKQEFKRRVADKEEIAPSLTEEAEALKRWAAEMYRDVPEVSAHTIENHIRDLYRKAKPQCPTK